jgi:hypothetical protein
MPHDTAAPAKWALLLTYEPREGVDLDRYHDWLRAVDNPFFNGRPAVKHYANWRVADSKLGSAPFTHFDLLEIEGPTGYDAVFGDALIVAFARDWVRLWGKVPDPDTPDQAVNCHVCLCEHIAAPDD